MKNEKIDDIAEEVGKAFPALSKSKIREVARQLHGKNLSVSDAEIELRKILRHKTMGYDQLLAMGLPYEPLKKLITEIEDLGISHFRRCPEK